MALQDDWMPDYQVSARYRIGVNAPPARVFHVALTAGFARAVP